MADYTVTFTAPKLGMFQGKASENVGQLIVRDIGSPPELISKLGTGRLHWAEPNEFEKFAVCRKSDGNKGDYGHALIAVSYTHLDVYKRQVLAVPS